MADKKPFADRQIVLVDDNARFLMVVRSMMRELGFERIAEFTDPEKAFWFASQVHVDVMVTDLMMPKVDGFQLAVRLRHDTAVVNRLMPILMITGHVDLKNVRKAINAGIDDVLAKPFSPRQLQDRLVALLAKPRVYIKTQNGYFGPDRRRREKPGFDGPDRRQRDTARVVTPQTVAELKREERMSALVMRKDPPPVQPAVAVRRPRDPFLLD